MTAPSAPPPTEPNRYDSTRHAWEDIWDQASVPVELEAVEYARSKATIDLYAPYLPKNVPLLEAGSGLSAVVITLRKMGYQVMGLDYAVNALVTSREYDPSLELFAGDVHHLPVKSGSMGAYLSFGVLEHFEAGMNGPLSEAYRILQPGGVLVLTIPYPNVVNRLVAWRRKRRGVSVLNDDDFYESTYTRDALIREASAAGFTLIKAVPTSHSYTLWGLGGIFRAPGYYRTSATAELLGGVLKTVLPWAFNFTTLIIARKPA